MFSSSGILRRRPRALLVSLAVFLAALWAELLLDRHTGRFVFVGFASAVAISAWVGGALPAIVTIVLSAIACDLYLFGPGQLLSFNTGSEVTALAIFMAGWTTLAVVAGSAEKRVSKERNERLAAERVAAQAHRLAQSTAALGQVRTSEEAIAAALHEPLHWLRAGAGVFYLLSDDRRHITIAQAVGYQLNEGDVWDLESFGSTSPFGESMRRLTPIVTASAHNRGAEYEPWSKAGPWRDREAGLIMPIAIERRVVAFLQIDFDSPREFTVDDHEYIHTICSRTAQALNRTWWHESVERARVDAETLKARADEELVERERTEHALRSSETRYRALATRTTRLHALTSSLSESVSVTAVSNAIVEQARIVVGAAEGELKLLGETPESHEPGLCTTEALKTGRPVFVGSLADSPEKHWLSAARAADNGFASVAALPLMVKGGPLGVLEFHFSAPVNFDDEYQALLISVAQHCTQALDRARLYEQAERARSDAERANRLKDEFVSTVSHELRTPLNAILGWASMLRTGSMEPDVLPQAIESIYRNASRQAKLVDDLLDFARMDSGRTALDLDSIDAPNLIRGVVESVSPLAAGSQIDIQLSAIPDATFRGDVKRLEQVFVNLIGNSLKFTPAGGHIMVSARIVGRALEIRVADSGIGIEPEFLPHVFDRFRQGDGTTTRNHSGLGLGLSIAKQLVEAHKGTIRAESAGRGKGTAFIVTLPIISHDAAIAATPAVEVPADVRLDGVRVLVVDDEKDTRDLIGRALKDRGASITVAENSYDAIEILERDEIDVLLADIAMPGEDGYSLIRQIRAAESRMSSIPAAAVTAHARDDERTRALAAGFHVHMAKPVEPSEIVRMVNTLRHERRSAVGGYAGRP
jgi:signal transduction histidine kinase/ActR/RegA family two-component response regulator